MSNLLKIKLHLLPRLCVTVAAYQNEGTTPNQFLHWFFAALNGHCSKRALGSEIQSRAEHRRRANGSFSILILAGCIMSFSFILDLDLTGFFFMVSKARLEEIILFLWFIIFKMKKIQIIFNRCEKNINIVNRKLNK